MPQSFMNYLIVLYTALGIGYGYGYWLTYILRMIRKSRCEVMIFFQKQAFE